MSYPREQKITATFYSDDETAWRVKEQMEAAVLFLVTPTKEAASELFRIGFEAVAIAAEAERESLRAVVQQDEQETA